MIFIASPSYANTFDARYIVSLISTIDLLKKNKLGSTWFSSSGALLCRVRNFLVHNFLESEADTMVFIDADILWEPKDFMKLIDSPYNLIGGNYLRKNGVEFAVNRIEQTEKDVVEIEALPTGFMKIDRKVFERIATELKLKPYNKEGHLPFFQVEYGDNTMVSEDVYFCKTWTKLGGQCRADLSIKLGHIGERIFTKDPKQHFFTDMKVSQATLVETFKSLKNRLDNLGVQHVGN